MNRRGFLKCLALAPALPLTAKLHAVPQTKFPKGMPNRGKIKFPPYTDIADEITVIDRTEHYPDSTVRWLSNPASMSYRPGGVPAGTTLHLETPELYEMTDAQWWEMMNERFEELQRAQSAAPSPSRPQ